MMCDPIHTTTTTPLQDDFHEWTRMHRAIKACRTLPEFVAVYDSFPYQSCLARIRSASNSSKSVELFAQEWAVRMRHPSPADVVLNQDRKVALTLVYALCDGWKDPLNDNVTETSIRQEFKMRRLANILQLALPMDRAQALYAMRYPGSTVYGMDWVSKQDVSASTALEQSLKAKGGFPTMNHRLVRLMASPVLGLSDIPVLCRWTEPKLQEQIDNN